MSDNECNYQKYWAEQEYEEKSSIPRNNGKVIDCVEDDCSLGYFVFDNPGYTIESILNIYEEMGKRRNREEKFPLLDDQKREEKEEQHQEVINESDDSIEMEQVYDIM